MDYNLHLAYIDFEVGHLRPRQTHLPLLRGDVDAFENVHAEASVLPFRCAQGTLLHAGCAPVKTECVQPHSSSVFLSLKAV